MTDDVVSKLTALWEDLLKTGNVSPDADFFECGGTSILAVHLAASIQEEFAVAVDAIEVVTLRTFGKLADLIASRLSEAHTIHARE